MRLVLRNRGLAAVDLPGRKGVFAWVIAARSREESWLTEKLDGATWSGAWPRRLAAGRQVELARWELAGRTVYARLDRRGVLLNYLGSVRQRRPKKAPPMPKAVGRLGSKLSEGKLMLLCRVHIPRAGPRPLILTSNKLQIQLAPPPWAKLTPAGRKAYLSRLLQRFDKNAWSAKAAHDAACRVGAASVPALIRGVLQRKRPSHARLWLATALADIRDKRAAATLVRLLDDPAAGVRGVVAYYGPTQQDAALDEAIVARTLARKDPSMLAYAMTGFLCHRGIVQEKLVAAGLDSTDPRVRGRALEMLRGRASDYNLRKAAALLADKNPRVVGVAARTLAAMGRHGPRVIAALVAAVKAPDAGAQFHICNALSALTSRDGRFAPQAGEEARRKAIAAWQAWWTRQQARTQPRSGRTD